MNTPSNSNSNTLPSAKIKTLSDATTLDFAILLRQFRTYMETVLEFDDVCFCDVEIYEDKLQFELVAYDKFQNKLDYNNMIGRVNEFISFNFDTPFEEAAAEVFKTLNKRMRRDERELRYALYMSSQLVEGAEDFISEYGKLFAARIKKVHEAGAERLITLQHNKGQ